MEILESKKNQIIDYVPRIRYNTKSQQKNIVRHVLKQNTNNILTNNVSKLAFRALDNLKYIICSLYGKKISFFYKMIMIYCRSFKFQATPHKKLFTYQCAQGLSTRNWQNALRTVIVNVSLKLIILNPISVKNY